MAAREIVEHDRAVRLELGQLLVHLQAVLKSPSLGIMIAQDLQRLHILRIAADQSLQEGNLYIQLARLFARQPFVFGLHFSGIRQCRLFLDQASKSSATAKNEELGTSCWSVRPLVSCKARLTGPLRAGNRKAR